MPSLIVWILAIYGAAFLVSDAKILSDWIPLRPLLQRVGFLKDLLQCYFCMGIWLGAGGWFLFAWPDVWRKEAFLYVLAAATGAYLLDMLVSYLEAKTMAAEVKTMALMQQQPPEETDERDT
jgi:hypothetical protein